MIVLLALLVAALVIGLVPVIATTVARSVAQTVHRAKAASIDQDLVEARLGRIEEAIDALALQVQRLTEQQQLLLGRDDRPPEAPAPEAAFRAEPPR
ncbi:MAG: hypothetical protein HUU26_05015 [Gemmatimonadaceae bacterium]|nr:hypothetical protein [Gemmatimonadaceae bacterium]